MSGKVFKNEQPEPKGNMKTVGLIQFEQFYIYRVRGVYRTTIIFYNILETHSCALQRCNDVSGLPKVLCNDVMAFRDSRKCFAAM